MLIAALLFAAAVSSPGELLQVTETEDGVVFYLRANSVNPHPLGHEIDVYARGVTPRHLVRGDSTSPTFIAIESRWVVVCQHGSHSIVRDHFYDAGGQRVAVFTNPADDQHVPLPGSISHFVLKAACGHIAHPRK